MKWYLSDRSKRPQNSELLGGNRNFQVEAEMETERGHLEGNLEHPGVLTEFRTFGVCLELPGSINLTKIDKGLRASRIWNFRVEAGTFEFWRLPELVLNMRFEMDL